MTSKPATDGAASETLAESIDKRRERTKLVQLITKQMIEKGDRVVGQVEQRIRDNRGIDVKGHTVDPEGLAEALAAYKAATAGTATASTTSDAAPKAPTATGTLAFPADATSTTAPKHQYLLKHTLFDKPARWTAPEATNSALASRVVSECDNAEPFARVITVVGGNKVAVLTKPNVSSTATGEYLEKDEKVEVLARAVGPRDGRVYLRLRKYTGWVTTRSRKDYSKIVLGIEPGSNGPPLEPPLLATATISRAVQLLQPMGADGNVDPSASKGAAVSQKVAFRALGGRCILLPEPNNNSARLSAGTLQNKEEFVACGVYMNAAEGRAYLRLADGRGWVCERLLAQFTTFAAQPSDLTLDLDVDHSQEAAPARKVVSSDAVGGAARKRVVITTHNDAVDEASFTPPPKAPQAAEPKFMVYRSDGELWPDPGLKGHPVSKEIRVKLRQLFQHYGINIRNCEEDCKDVTDKAESYKRECDATKTLKTHADTLQKEIAKMHKEWAKAVEKIFVDAGESMPKVGEIKQGQNSSVPGGVTPVQVSGTRWYCAMIRPENASEVTDEMSPEKVDKSVVRHMGPLRQTPAEAVEDMQGLRKRLVRDDDSSMESSGEKRRKVSPENEGGA